MSKKKSNEELQNRREFFKKAAKAALPVVGTVVLSSLPIVKAKAVTNCWNGSCVNGCGNSCVAICAGGCDDSCYGSCRGTCNAQSYYK